jgi:Fur family ferric uptake transcriptional regulator
LCLEDVHIPEVTIPDGYSAQSASYLLRGICPECQK